MGQGRSLELFFVDGNPEGMLTAEVFNWTGHILKAPRTRLKAALDRPEAGHTGVYILLGNKDGQPLAYIGESEEVGKRIRNHDSGKDWWTEMIIVTTSADVLHKAHVKYLESRLVQIASEARVRALENGNQPPRSSLSEASLANMEEFIATLRMVLPALGVDLLTSGRRSVTEAVPPAQAAAAEIVFRLTTRVNKVDARAVLRGADFIMLKGSHVRAKWEGKGVHDVGYRLIHDRLAADGVILNQEGVGVLLDDYAFNSPSAAAAVANGRPANGRIEWRHPDGRTYAEWEQDDLKDGS